MSQTNDATAQPPSQADEPDPSRDPPVHPEPPPNASSQDTTSLISRLLSALSDGLQSDDNAPPCTDADHSDPLQPTESDLNILTNMPSTRPDSHPSADASSKEFASAFSIFSSSSDARSQSSNSTDSSLVADVPDNQPVQSPRDTTANSSTEQSSRSFSWLHSVLDKAIQLPQTDNPSHSDAIHVSTEPVPSGDASSATDISSDDSLQTTSTDVTSAGDSSVIDSAADKGSKRPFFWLLSVLKTKTGRSKISDSTHASDVSGQDALAEGATSPDDPSTSIGTPAEDLSASKISNSCANNVHADDEIADDVSIKKPTPPFSWLFTALRTRTQPTESSGPTPADGVLDEGAPGDLVVSPDGMSAISDTPIKDPPQCTDSNSPIEDSLMDDVIPDEAVTGNSASPFSWVISALNKKSRPSETDGSTPSDDALGENVFIEDVIPPDDASAASDTPIEERPQCTDSTSSKEDAPRDVEISDDAATKDFMLPFAWLLSLLSANAEPSETMDAPLADDALDKDGIIDGTVLRDDSAANDMPINSDSSSAVAAVDAAVTHDSASLFSWLFSVLENGTRAPSKKFRELLQRTSTDLSQQAAVMALRAVGLEPFDTASEELDILLPRRPFDPVLALVLAGYAFRAYYDPPRSAHYEAFVVPVAGSAVSGLERQLIRTEFAYMDASFIAYRADGMFMLHVCEVKGLNDVYATAEVNSTIMGDLFSNRTASVLRIRDTYSAGVCEMLEREADMLILNLFASKRDYEEGKSPTCSASVSLVALVKEGLERGTYVDGDRVEVIFEEVRQEEKNRDFFHFSLLPKELKLPFQSKQSASPDANAAEEKNTDSPSISVQVSFIPFPKGAKDEKAAASGILGQIGGSTSSTSLVDTTVQDPLSKERITSLLAKEPSPGQLPSPEDWSRLASVAKSVIKQVGEHVGFERSGSVTENLSGSVFIESLTTDTEVWLFHDEAEKSIVISFRGTEQGSWRDLFTDAQVFLQRWSPGEDVNLNVDLNNTVGLADLVPNIMPHVGSPIPKDASAVHYGFLRAFLSIRDSVTRSINLLSSDLSEGYSLHFTGHSLGGALATLAAADFQAKHLFDNHNVTCMSFGAPKVGNMHFAKLYNRLVPNSFRIVNDADLISRMPRSLRSGNPLGRYKHAGRTVLVNEDGDYWIEGHVDTRSFNRMVSLEDPFRERYKNISDLLAFEQSLWLELLSGRAVQQHMVSTNAPMVMNDFHVYYILAKSLYYAIAAFALCRKTHTTPHCREFCRKL